MEAIPPGGTKAIKRPFKKSSVAAKRRLRSPIPPAQDDAVGVGSLYPPAGDDASQLHLHRFCVAAGTGASDPTASLANDGCKNEIRRPSRRRFSPLRRIRFRLRCIARPYSGDEYAIAPQRREWLVAEVVVFLRKRRVAVHFEARHLAKVPRGRGWKLNRARQRLVGRHPVEPRGGLGVNDALQGGEAFGRCGLRLATQAPGRNMRGRNVQEQDNGPVSFAPL
jgi:hypothetical protein